MKRHHSVNFYIAIISFLLFAVVLNAQEGNSEPMGNDPWIYVELQDAILRGDLNAVRGLLDKGANVNAMLEGGPVLFHAVVEARARPSYEPKLPQAELRAREDIVRLLLDRGADVNLRSTNGRIFSVCGAITANQPGLLKLLLDRGAKAAHLTDAVYRGHMEDVRLLLQYGANVNERDDEGTPLAIAIKQNRVEAALFLIENGADVNMKDHRGNTPLFYARERQYDSLPLIALLTGRGAHESLWDNSAFRGSVRVGVFLMILSGVIILLIRENRNLGPYRPRENALHFDRKDWRPSTIRVIKGDRWAKLGVIFGIVPSLLVPLLVYSSGQFGYFWKSLIQTWEFLIDYPLYLVILCMITLIPAAMVLIRTTQVRSLFKKGVAVQCKGIQDLSTGGQFTSDVSPDLRIYEYSYGGDTYRVTANLMPWSGWSGEIALVDPDDPGRAIIRDNYTKTARRVARNPWREFYKRFFSWAKSTQPVQSSQIKNDEKAGDEQEVDEIVFNLLYSRYSTVDLMHAVTSGNLEKVKSLVEDGADINDGGEHGITPLMWAAGRGHLDIVKYLIEKKSDVNRANNTGRTPLMFSANGGYPEITRFLLANGADRQLADKNGLTALAMARKKGHTDVIQVLRETRLGTKGTYNE